MWNELSLMGRCRTRSAAPFVAIAGSMMSLLFFPSYARAQEENEIQSASFKTNFDLADEVQSDLPSATIQQTVPVIITAMPLARSSTQSPADVEPEEALVIHNQPQAPRPSAEAPQISWEGAPSSVPLALKSAIEIVTERDPAVLAAWWQVRAAGSGVRSARWRRFPSLTVDSNISGRSDWFLPSLTVDLPLWAGGQIGANIGRARTQEASAEAGWEEVILDLALQVNDTYFEIVLNTKLEQLYQESLAAHQDLVATMERRVAQRVSAQADLELARSRAAQIEQDMLIVQSQRETALQNLAELVSDPNYELGYAPDFEKDLLVESWDTVLAESLEFSPTRQRLALQAQVAEHEIDLAKAALFPQISAQYAYNDITGSRVGLGVRIDTANGLSRLSDIDTAGARYQTALDQTRLFERQLRQQIANEVTANYASLSRTDVSRIAALTAERVSESYVRQFIAGRRSWLDVMNALREHLAAQSGLLQAEVTAMTTSVRLNLRSGRWRPQRVSGEY